MADTSTRLPRIVHLTSVHPRHDSRIYLKECCGLAANGFEVHLVVADGRGAETSRGVHIHDVGVLRGRMRRLLRTTGRVYRAAAALDADLYLLHDPELIPAGLRLMRRGRRVVFDSHEDVPLQLLSKHYLPRWLLRLVAAAYGALERYACSRFAGIVAATPTIRDRFLQMNPRTVAICNFPRPDEFIPEADWAEKRDEVCYVGGIGTVRGAREMVAAMARVGAPTRLNLVGDFSEATLRADLAAAPGWSKVNEFGPLDRSGVRSVYRRSRAGLVTLHPIRNYLDALPIKMFEYMSAGIPVIASDFPVWRRIIDDAQCGLCVDPLEPASIAAAIEALARDPALAQRLGANGRAAVENRYNWNSEEAALVAFCRQMIATGAPRTRFAP